MMFQVEKTSDIRLSDAAKLAGNVVCLFAAVIFAGSFSSAVEVADSFDAPIKVTSVDVGPSPQYEDPEIRTTLTCYYYADVMVKEHYEGGAGAALSMVRVRGALPACEPTHQRGEEIIDDPKWIGYLKGVKDTLVFFEAYDDFNGDYPFAVFDLVSGEIIFTDSAYGEYVSSSGNHISRVKVIPKQDGYLLKYLRVRHTDCDLHLNGSACWKRVREEFGLMSNDVPVCTGYKRVYEIFEADHVESWIAYPVEVELFPRPIVTNVAGAVKCWPAQ